MRHVDFYEKAHSRSHLINVWWRGREETFGLVVFSIYGIEEGAPYRGETSVRIGVATWSRLDRATVAVSVGGKCILGGTRGRYLASYRPGVRTR